MKRDWGGVALPPSPRIATKAELDRLRQSRPVPAPERHLSPETADRDFAFAQNEGRAKADFERSR